MSNEGAVRANSLVTLSIRAPQAQHLVPCGANSAAWEWQLLKPTDLAGCVARTTAPLEGASNAAPRPSFAPLERAFYLVQFHS